MAKISIDNLAKEITKAVQRYTEDIEDAIELKVDEVADEMLKDVRRNSPIQTGRYRRGFRKTARDFGGKTTRIVWNKSEPTLVHLLEFGHAKVNGGRVNGKPHLRPAYDKNSIKLQNDIKRIIENGG